MGFIACHGRAARAALFIGTMALIVGAPGVGARAPEPDPELPIDPTDPWAPFEFAQRQADGPVITGSSPTATVAEVGGAAAAELEHTTADVTTEGVFGEQVAWPLVPIHAVLTPDGRVLTYGTDRNGRQTGFYDYDVWDPRLGLGEESHLTLPNETATDLFCSAQIVLPNGNVEVYGGDEEPPGNTYNRDVNQFRPSDNALVASGPRVPGQAGQMNLKRWYATATVLPNGEVLIQGGWGQGYDRTTTPVSVIQYPEVRNLDGTFRELRGAITDGVSNYYPRNFVAADGLVFGIADDKMYRLDPSGSGSLQMLGTFPGENRSSSSTAVMYRPGKILQAGGGTDGYHASADASLIDITTGTPQVSSLPPMQYRRHWGTSTVMADGRVLVSGGSEGNNMGESVLAKTAEIFDPSTNTWTTAATAQRMRLYHSVSLLLPDATVITMGGGTPGPETNLNAEVYYPPYLFQADGSPASRPTISAVTTATQPGATLSIDTPEWASIERVTLVKTGSITHSFDMDQRFIDLPFTRSGGKLQAVLPANPYDTPPGYYHVFVFDDAGVPSTSRIVKIGVPPVLPPPPVNVVVNGGFDANALHAGEAARLATVAGWTNGGRSIEVWRRYNGYRAKTGASNVEIDARGANNRLDQTIATVPGRQYTLSFWTSPRPGRTQVTNRFAVFWNGRRLAAPAYDGVGLTRPSWVYRSFVVSGTGSDVLSFREHDRDSAGALLDGVRLVVR